MKCPKCGREMLDGPVMDKHSKIMKYKFCLWCFPIVRILVRCQWARKVIGEDGFICTFDLKPKPCRLDSHPETGFVFCPQIRAFQTAGWAKAMNAEEEKKYG